MSNKRKRRLSLSLLNKLPLYLWYFLKCFFVFKSPISFIKNYIAIRSPKDNVLFLRNGVAVHLSDNPEDMVTAFLIFAKREYGKILKDSLILDIGANIGAFSIYASMNGAKKVYAYEPNEEAYGLLCKNISRNNLSDIVVPNRFVVSSEDGIEVRFPIKASPQNKIIEDDHSKEYELVQTITLGRIISDNKIYLVDLLKLDCQGMEYEIIKSLDKETVGRIHAVKMEYHDGNEDMIISELASHGFFLDLKRKESDLMGNLWFTRKSK